MKNSKRRTTIMALLTLLIVVSLGYALLNVTLKINGTSGVGKNNWEIYWDAVGDIQKTDTTEIVTPAEVDASDVTQVNFAVNLKEPGDYYEFQVDAVNNGTLDAMISKIKTTIGGVDIDEDPSVLPDYVEYTIKYADGVPVAVNHILERKKGDTPTRERYKIRIEYLRSITPEELELIPSTGLSLDITSDITYKQVDENGYNRELVVPSCPDCVYAFYTTMKTYDGETSQYLENHVVNYKDLKDSNGRQRRVFMGHKIDENNKILKSYVCELVRGNILCLEGSTTGSNFNDNYNLAVSKYGVWDVPTSYGCALLTNQIWCGLSTDVQPTPTDFDVSYVYNYSYTNENAYAFINTVTDSTRGDECTISYNKTQASGRTMGCTDR